MSILKRPYTISVWDDIWNAETGKFEEQRLGIIGTDNMLYQGRAIEPNLVQNVNGTKKFSFKMYKYFVDNETGERVENPFVNWLVSERKVKLQYKGKWHDFIVKNINEKSSNYLYTYQLEDALVQELSKNGFGITLDTELMNNMGTAKELATYVLSETDWDVSSEALVEKVEDNLVYINIPDGTTVYPIMDQSDLNEGITIKEPITISNNSKGWDVLAFYTSCTGKPHRFQFIYVSTGYRKEENGKFVPKVPTDENQIINIKNCQYYCEINKPEAGGSYIKVDTFPQFYLPTNFRIIDFGEEDIGNKHDTTISVWYRGYRYGFSQDAKYIPALDKYCNIYKKNDKKYYSYVDNDYISPVLLQNIITNTDFKGTTGWVGTYSGETPNAKNIYGAAIESIYGEFDSSKRFSSVVEQLSNGTYDSQKAYKSYLKVVFPQTQNGNQGILINTGFYDNRTLIGEVDYNEEWYFEPTILTREGEKVGKPYITFDFKLREVAFNTKTGAYRLGKIWAETIKDDNGEIIPNRLRFGLDPNNEEAFEAISKEEYFTTHADVKVSKQQFEKKEIKLVITPKVGNNQTYYIQDMQLFKLVTNDEAKIIKPGDLEVEGIIKTTNRFFLASEVEEDNGDIKQEPVDIEAIKYENFDKTEMDYSVYVPQYNQGAQKVRSVDAKESNYFNILQSIAEKFEAWLELEIGRNDQGGITSKTVKFKNYAGKDNYASFRYGVNLKDIQRTYESKNIVTKLIVKQNSNEHAENGFCTIARADANQTGENYIYDFRYYHDRNMLDKIEYIVGLYYSKNKYHEGLVEAGPDIIKTPCANPDEHGQDGHNCYNLQNYFNRVKNLNIKIQDINDAIAPKQNELIKLKADLVVQEGLRDAATEGLEEVREDFQALTGVTPETIAGSGVDVSPSSIQSLLNEYATYTAQYNEAINKLEGYWQDGSFVEGLKVQISEKEQDIKNNQEEIDIFIEHKKQLNKLFYSCYSRFIQEGTWIDEKYIDDNKYYTDAQSVMYNSCYPQVAYTINVVALSALPGYEYFDFELGDKTYAIDPEFFGEDHQEEVIINELSENLDDPSRDQIKVQNFKNQFQDLFQKITATVQQTQYSSGSYEKAVALAEASAAIKSEFLQDAFNSANDTLSKAGQTSVKWGENGITLTDSDTKNEMRLIGGAILMSIQDENGQRKWKTGLTPEGISASLVTAGTVDTGKIQIKNGKDVTFLWNSFGISAFDVDWNNGEVVGTPDTSKFVRFDKHGIYGIDIGANEMKDGMSWKPKDGTDIDKAATFALTWEGLKVKGENATLRIGDGAKVFKNDDTLLSIKDNSDTVTFAIKNDGSIIWGSEGKSSSPTQVLYSSSKSSVEDKPVDGEQWTNFPPIDEEENGAWHRQIGGEDKFASYTYNGGVTWQSPIQIVGADGKDGADGAQGPQGPQGEAGANGTDGASVYILFHDYVEGGTPKSPTNSYFEYPDYEKTGWYRVQQSEIDDYKGSVYSCSKIATPYEEDKVAWGPVNRISGVLTTKEDLLSILSDYPTADGIYNSEGIICINASAINAGVLNVGGTSAKDYKDGMLYVNKDNSEVFIGGWQVSKDGLVYPLKDNKEVYYSGFTSSDVFYASQFENEEWVLKDVALFAGNSLAERTTTEKATRTLNKNVIIYSFKQEEVETIAKKIGSKVEDLDVTLSQNEVSYDYGIALYEASENRKTVLSRFQPGDVLELTRIDSTEVVYSGQIERFFEKELPSNQNIKYAWCKLGASQVPENYPLITNLSDPTNFQGKVYGAIDGEKAYVRIDDLGVESVGTARVQYSLGTPIKNEETGQCNIGARFKLRFKPYVDGSHGFDHVSEMIGIRLADRTSTGAVAYLCLAGIPTIDGKVLLGWNIFSGQGVYYDEDEHKTKWTNGWYNPDETVHWSTSIKFSVLKDSLGQTLEIPTTNTFSDWTKDFVICILSDDETSGAVDLYYKIGYNGKIIYDSSKAPYEEIHFIQPKEKEIQNLTFTPYFASRCIFDIADVYKNAWIDSEDIYEENNTSLVKPEFYIAESNEPSFIFSTMPNDPNFYVTHDGEIYAKKGKIGALDIESIPDEGYMPSEMDNQFSWKFSPTDGMFMWNGNIPTSYSDVNTKDAIFAIYNDPDLNEDGTFKNNHYKLSMKGHIEAESGKIGDWEIHENFLGSGELGKKNSFILSQKGIYSYDALFNQRYVNTWVLGIGENFGVTEEGEIYASSGKIGGWNFTKDSMYGDLEQETSESRSQSTSGGVDTLTTLFTKTDEGIIEGTFEITDGSSLNDFSIDLYCYDIDGKEMYHKRLGPANQKQNFSINIDRYNQVYKAAFKRSRTFSNSLSYTYELKYTTTVTNVLTQNGMFKLYKKTSDARPLYLDTFGRLCVDG